MDTIHMVNGSLNCGGPAVALADWLWPPASSISYAQSWPQLRDRTVIGTHRGRTAISLACRLLGLRQGDEVLIPSYNCGTELDALIKTGITPVPYRISMQCRIDLGDLISKKTNRTRAVYLIHYFGWEQPMKELKSWCEEHHLLLMEDCALALFSSGASGDIGRMGDAAIFSLPKTLGFAFGGLLSLSAASNSGAFCLKPSGAATRLKEIRHSTRTIAVRGLKHLGIFGLLSEIQRNVRPKLAHPVHDGELPDMPTAYYFSSELDSDRGLDSGVGKILNSVQWENVVQMRRRNYAYLVSALEGIAEINPLFPKLPRGVCPLSLPLLVLNRDRLASHLQEKGVAAYPWWAGFHRYGMDWSQFPEACWLKHHVITIPVYQGMAMEALDILAELVADFVSSPAT